MPAYVIAMMSIHDPETIELYKYGLWDSLDNLQDAYERESLSFQIAYWDTLKSTIDLYSKIIGYDILHPTK